MADQPKAYRVATGTATIRHMGNQGCFGSLFLWVKKIPDTWAGTGKSIGSNVLSNVSKKESCRYNPNPLK